MLYGLAAILLVIVIIFGVASSMQSYAVAEQARAQIEVAQVAQINAWGNLIVILVLALLIVSVLAFIVWMLLRRMPRGRGVQPGRPVLTEDRALSLPAAPVSVETLIQLETLRVLRSMNPPPVSPGVGNEAPLDLDDLSWLRRS